jgi:AP2-associated kinase
MTLRLYESHYGTLSGGFAHVYLVKSTSPIADQYQHVLKRLAVPDKVELQHVRKEVDVMVSPCLPDVLRSTSGQKLLRGNRHIVNFIEASASELPNKGGYEVFILMEYAPGSWK